MTALTITLVVLAIYIGGAGLVITFFYLFPRHSNFKWPQSARRATSFAWEWLSAIVTEILLPFFQFFWPWWWHLRKGHPVLFLHGYGQNRADFFWMGLRLRRLHRGPLVGVNYWYMASLERCARRISKVVERWSRRSPTGRVDLVCHSYGGVVARYYVEHLGGGPNIRQIITIASPHRGTRWAKGGLGTASRQMDPDNRLWQTFRFPTPPKGVRYCGVWSRADAVVVPPSSSSLMGAGPERVFNHLGHLSLLLSPTVTRIVQKWLDEG